ncbi:polyprenyl synthetase family protein [Parasporobacterium paucivorans]|uniref:Heptaprenyl diphosphate synthase n=1 Tax=Parasporobacterium paucivorans DSM 15970 TaxID=1122934 RepID=A0A1M6DGR7_9FIRM|nr:polyprenyl synthetase family protein [Parasporobacterium paucivorans]SHI72466.1 heptaprenyl diphosphate synthase [Parasporobacterium paucivorans DSM 15970]
MTETIAGLEVRKKIKENVALQELTGELNRLEALLVKACGSDNAMLTENLKRIILSGGKRLRPSLAYLCHGLAGYAGGDRKKREILPLMCMLELMHTASLIHDDVIDHSDERRGVITIHKVIGRHSAIKSGDYLLAKAMEHIPAYHGTGISEVLADTAAQMCLGEVQQMRTAFSREKQTYENYILQIKRKTAYLLAASCYTGAVAGGFTLEEAKSLRSYGENIGIAFQIKDDILDFKGSRKLGKPLGQDLRKGIFTLPLMKALEAEQDAEMLKLACAEEKSETDIERLIRFVVGTGSIGYTENKVREYSQKAIWDLETFPESPQKAALTDLAEGLAERKL